MTGRTLQPITPGTREEVAATIASRLDPSGTAAEWLVTTGQNDPDPDSADWATGGSWDSSWSSTTGLIDVSSPTIGDASAVIDLESLGEGEYTLWVRWSYASARPMKDVATVVYGY